MTEFVTVYHRIHHHLTHFRLRFSAGLSAALLVAAFMPQQYQTMYPALLVIIGAISWLCILMPMRMLFDSLDDNERMKMGLPCKIELESCCG